MKGLILWVWLPSRKIWFDVAHVFDTYTESFAELDDIIERCVPSCTKYMITDENDKIIYVEAYRV